jgi:hypothetical protein
MIDIEKIKYKLDMLKRITLREAKKYCEPDRLESWSQGYTTAVDDVLELIEAELNVGK